MIITPIFSIWYQKLVKNYLYLNNTFSQAELREKFKKIEESQTVLSRKNNKNFEEGYRAEKRREKDSSVLNGKKLKRDPLRNNQTNNKYFVVFNMDVKHEHTQNITKNLQ